MRNQCLLLFCDFPPYFNGEEDCPLGQKNMICCGYKRYLKKKALPAEADQTERGLRGDGAPPQDWPPQPVPQRDPREPRGRPGPSGGPGTSPVASLWGPFSWGGGPPRSIYSPWPRPLAPPSRTPQTLRCHEEIAQSAVDSKQY